jgi:hypothetical protein
MVQPLYTQTSITLHLHLLNDHFPPGYPTRIMYEFIILAICATYRTQHILLVNSTNYDAPHSPVTIFFLHSIGLLSILFLNIVAYCQLVPQTYVQQFLTY